jgi:hypothetical protein
MSSQALNRGSAPMSERPDAQNEQPQPAPAAAWRRLAALADSSVFYSAISVGAALARLFPHFRWESLPVVAAVLATALFALLLNQATAPHRSHSGC